MIKNPIISYQLNISIEEYVSIFTEKSKSNRFVKKIFKSILLMVITIACLFWAYTFLLGIILIILQIAFILVPKIFPKNLEKTYESLKYIHYPITYTFDLKEIIVDGNNLFIKTTWEYLESWTIRNKWLVLNFNGIPSIFIPMDLFLNTKEKDDLIDIFKKYGKEY